MTDFLRQTSMSDLSLNLAIVVNPIPNVHFFLITNKQLSLMGLFRSSFDVTLAVAISDLISIPSTILFLPPT